MNATSSLQAHHEHGPHASHVPRAQKEETAVTLRHHSEPSPEQPAAFQLAGARRGRLRVRRESFARDGSEEGRLVECIRRMAAGGGGEEYLVAS